MMVRFVLTFLLSASLLTGCGFHLRGNITVAPELAQMHVIGNDSRLVVKMVQRLSESGVTIERSAEVAGAVLRIAGPGSTRTVSTLDERGKATGYVLHYVVNYNVVNKAGKTIVNPTRIALRRDFNFDATQVLQKEGEAAFLINDMRDEAVLRILSKLGRVGKTAANFPLGWVWKIA